MKRSVTDTKRLWLEKFREKASQTHKRNLDKFAKRMLTRSDGWKYSLASRSKKHNVECTVTVEELRELMYSQYGTSCRYCGRKLDINNIVLDHIIPISKGGTSNPDNLQIICKASNAMKGSLDETNFSILLNWLDSIPEELKKDISIRLARGVR
jgi:5-methylcytosine-specific restriction endonuclease McrA